MIPLKWILLFCHVIGSALGYYESQPKINSQNGHLILESGLNRNITFRMVGLGRMRINNVDILSLLNQATNSITPGTPSQDLTRISTRLAVIESKVNGRNGIMLRLQTLESNYRNSSQTQNGPIRMRQINRRLDALELRVETIFTKLNEDNCRSVPCQNGGTCVDGYDTFQCQCPSNWQGRTCSEDVNECANFAGTDLGCQNLATCINTPGSYTCQCRDNYQGMHCSKKIKDCTSASSYELCGHGICISSTTNGYQCLCDAGWKLNTPTIGVPMCVVDINECESEKPHCSVDPPVVCRNLDGSYTCGPCPVGYTGNGHYCVDINECEVNNGGCSTSPSVICHNTRGSHYCDKCPLGYLGDGRLCIRSSNTCENANLCHPLARCVEFGSGIINCICRDGFTGSGFGNMGCSAITGVAVDGCTSNPCLNGGTCTSTGPSSYVCGCPADTLNPNCKRPPSPCDSNPCQNGGTCRAANTRLQYACSCVRGFVGRSCERNTPLCGGIKNAESGTIKYPPEGSYQSNEKCAWLIKTRINKVLNVTFTQFHLEESSECRYDWLQIHDGRTTAARNIGRFCGTQLPLGGNFVSTHNLLYLWFRSDNSSSHPGFNLSWDSIDPQCGEVIESNSHGTISSPGSPGNYPINRNCFWYIKAPPGKRLQLHFYTMKIEIHSNCSYDFVRVFQGSLPEVGDEDPSTLVHNVPIIAEFCNTTIPGPVTTPTNEITIYFHSDGVSSDSGFQMHYTVTEGTPGCGGVFTSKKGEFGTPIEDGNYPNGITCEYLLQLPLNSKIKLRFLEVDIEHHSDCRFDFVKIYDGDSDQSSLITTLCGRTVPAEITSSTHMLFLRFKSDWSREHKGFRAAYETVCGGRFDANSGVISSPFYPTRYEGDQICHFYIETPLSTAIKLEFTDFDLESTGFRECAYDSVTIYDGIKSNQTEIGRYCGSNAPPTLWSTTNYLHLEFRSDVSIEGRGFKANYSTIDTKCGGIMKSNNGVIRPPENSNGEGYSHSTHCQWVIVAPPGEAIQLQFSSFDLESSSSCDYDYLQVFDNSSDHYAEIGKFCGQRTPPAITSSQNILTLIFQTDSSRNAAGFSATYNFIDTRTMCGGNFFSPRGYIRSPGWPHNYDAGKNCQWVIQAPKGQQITLNVLAFSLEAHDMCRFDWLEIRNGGSETSPLIGKFCGTQFPNNTIRSFGNKLFLRFVSDISRQSKGFNIEYDSTATGCGGRLTSYQGFVTSPHYPDHYDSDTICSWQIIVNPGSSIEMIFTDLDMESLSDCYYDYIEMYDGRDVTGRKLGKYCDSESHPLQIVTNSNLAFLRMKTDGSGNGRGFNIKYRAVCSRTLTDMYGVIESPNFPNSYPANINCEWKIQGPKSSKIMIDFTHFDLERVSWAPDECTYDFVTIVQHKEEQEILTQYCTNLPGNITSFGNVLSIKFKTDVSGSGKGFRLEYKIEGCGGLLTKPSGNILSPDYPNHYPKNTLCQWQIEAEPDNSIQLTIHHLLIEGTNQCGLDYLLISANPGNNSHYLRKICNSLNVTQVITGPRIMYLTFESDSSITGMGFNASYQVIPHNCGGLQRGTSGFITSPGYPQNYPSEINCEYLIEVPQNHLVELNMMDFNVEGDYNYYTDEDTDSKCPHDRVLIVDGPNRTNNVLLTHCGTRLPNITKYISSSNQMLVVFETDHSRNLNGFKFNYTMSCGTTIVVNGSGKIETPLDVLTENCTWHLKAADPTQHITFNIGYITGFDYGNMGSFDETNNCTVSIDIYDSDTMETPIKKRYCGSYNDLRPTISTGQYLTINLHVLEENYYSRQKLNFVGFYSTFDTACGGEFNILNGKIASPEYPLSYPLDVECAWKIISSPGNAMSLVVSDMNILTSDNHCNEDYLEVRNKDESGGLLGTFCGNNPVSNLTSNNGFWIKFRSGTTGVARGFLAQFFYSDHTEIKGTEGEIGSPLYPEMFFGYAADYTWRITVSHKSVISLTFNDFIVDAHSTYCFVRLQIYDGYNTEAPELATNLCGTEIPDTLKSTSNMMFIRLEQNRGFFGTRFLLKWKKMSLETISDTTDVFDPKCGNKTIQLTEAKPLINFTSPGWPDGYDSGLTCSYIISSNMTNYHTKFTLHEIDLEDSDACVSDYVQISSSNDLTTWTPLGKKCGTNSDKNFEFEGSPYLKIDFISNYYLNKTGFSGVVSLECGNIIRGSNGVISYNSNRFLASRIFYSSNVCMWNITVRAGHTIRYSFTKMNFTTSNPPNCGSALVFKNGLDDSSPILGVGKYCGSSIPDIPMTISNRGFVKLTSKFSDYVDFELKFEEVGVDCNDNLQLTHFFNQTVIMTPNYPNIPQPHSKCTWTINVPSGEYIKLEFMDFNLIQSEGCQTEYVEIRMGTTRNSPLVDRFCGDRRPKLMVKNNLASVTYYTSSDTPHNGFKMKAQIAPCGAVYEGNNGLITSPNYKDGGYAPNMQCEYHVITLPGTYINFTFIDIDLPVHWNEASNCTGKDKIEIFTAEPNDDENSNITYNLQSLGVFCEDALPPPIITESNEAFIKFTSNGNQESSENGWSIKYTASSETCGGRLNIESGEITSPGYPNKRLNARFCDWYITVPKGRRIKIEIEDLDFVLAAIPTQRLIFYNDHSLASRIVLLRGGSTQRIVYSSDNKLRINYWNRTPSKNRGFKLSYTSFEQSVCFGDLNSMDGIIQQPFNQTTFVCEYIRTAGSFYPEAPNVGTLALEFFDLKFPQLNFQFCLPTASKLTVLTESNNEIASICKNNSITVRSPSANIKVVSKKNVFYPLLEYKLGYKVHKCGGIMSSNGDEIIVKSTPFAQNYSKLDCAWQINFGEGEKVMANIVKINFKKSCDKEYMIIYQGGSSSGPSIKRYCDTVTTEIPVISQNNQLFLEYHTDEYTPESEFEIRFNSSSMACGGFLKHTARLLTSPAIASNTTRRYPHNAECIWEIESRTGYHIGLVFTNRFNLEQSENCTNDYVEVFDYIDDGWKSLGRACGRTIPTPFNSTTTRMRVIFRSNNDVNGDGFTAKWLENCGGTFTASQTKNYISSPGYPDKYLPFTTCNYTITANANQHINIEFEDFQLEENRKGCGYDNVTLYRYREYVFPPELEKQRTYCGRRSPGAVRVNEKMVIEFRTDSSIERKGFRISYQTDSCGGLITEPGQIRTPKLAGDGKYPQGLVCYWNITANEPSKRISITFDMMQLEHSQACYFDHIEIYKGLEPSEKNRIAKLCGNDTGHTINIDSNKGIIHFKSDSNNNFDGFVATIAFTEFCDQKIALNDTTEKIIPFSEYRAYMNCHYSVTALAGTVIKLTFNNFHVAPCAGSLNATVQPCSCDYLEVRDGLTPFSEVLGRYCGHTIPEPIISSLPSLYIIFVTDGQTNSAGFEIKVKMEVSLCGQTYYNLTSNDQSFEIRSPGGDTYPPNLVCRWIIECVSPRTIELEFIKFDLQEMGDYDCSYDVLEISDTSQKSFIGEGLGTELVYSGKNNNSRYISFHMGLRNPIYHTQYCGSKIPMNYLSYDQKVELKFQTDSIIEKGGFILRARLAHSCERNYTSTQGRIKHEGMDTCTFWIIAPQNYTISLYFIQVYYPETDCTKNGIKMYENGPGGKLVLNQCGYSTPSPLFLTTNQVYVETKASTTSGDYWNGILMYDIYYLAQTQEQGPGCGGDIYNYGGMFASPGYPTNDRNNSDCRWNIIVPVYKVALRFAEFDMGTASTCDTNYVEIIETDGEGKDTVARTYCGGDTPAIYRGLRNTVSIRLRKTVNFAGTGFEVQFLAAAENADLNNW